VELPYYPTVETLAAWCDVLIVAAAASDATRGLVGAPALAALGRDGWLVNVSRGSLVDEAALTAALAAGAIGGAALDVFADEPAVPLTLAESDRTLLTPHIGSATVETRWRMGDLLLANIDAYLAGRSPPTIVRA
jgi:hydroxypyruvate reductase